MTVEEEEWDEVDAEGEVDWELDGEESEIPVDHLERSDMAMETVTSRGHRSNSLIVVDDEGWWADGQMAGAGPSGSRFGYHESSDIELPPGLSGATIELIGSEDE
ncbi:hypothetical protein FRB94_012432 [Tulasnella sp. JGI-2019a]|nr:hypothetical protein FRB94_012432 [Tulasnella sp. JGI-2019a]KAG9033572.1 hypothetical protein FRB95_014650 [Tulasnella sp. JGI-2019a]